jgi:hypothetical protein
LEEKVAEVEAEEEAILGLGQKLSGSMIGRRRILTTWAVGEAWEQFSTKRVEVIQCSFSSVGLSLPIDGHHDHEISIKGLETSVFIEGLKDWRKGGLIDDEEDMHKLNSADDSADGLYEGGRSVDHVD